MDLRQLIVVAVALVVLLGIVWMFMRKQRTINLQKRFGPEYDRAVREIGPQRAESVLLEREKRVQEFFFRELSAEEREGFLSEWRTVQTRFVDDPQAAVGDADLLVDRLMQARGYPMSNFEQRAADISVGHPTVVDNYRAAHEIAVRHSQGQASTEDLRNAIIYYRSLFEELLQNRPSAHKKEVA
ncbi:MAG: hypothetical protein WCD57_12095 [Acidobacteriaceae bacterium]